MSQVLSFGVPFLLAAIGAFLVLVAGLGIVRMPDLLTRMHASSKAATLGGALILLAVALWFGDPAATARVVLIILFLFATAPVASHMIGRAGYGQGRPLQDENVIDEYRDAIEAGDDDQP
jgi:multicomponent Na+:H+ antiporter subunit G